MIIGANWRCTYRKINFKRLLLAWLIVHFSFQLLLKYFDLDNRRLRLVRLNYEESLAYMLEDDIGTGCALPYLDPYHVDMMKGLKIPYPKINCSQPDWVKCRFSTCSVQPVIIETMKDIQCVYQDIIHINDNIYKMGPNITLKGHKSYTLQQSDHVRILCSARKKNISRLLFWNESWFGYGTGLRQMTQRTSPHGRENSANIVMIAFDSLSKNAFIRLLPKSYKFIQEQLNATILNKYNAVGSGTAEAIIPMFSGNRFFELNDASRYFTKATFDNSRFIFEKLAKDGYRTAYLEELPEIGTFTRVFNGFPYQPTDHYLHSLFRDTLKFHYDDKHCFGETPHFQVLLNLTDQITHVKGKHFVFCLTADISHGSDPSYVPNADEPLVDFLKGLLKRGHQQNSIIIVMGDHGQTHGDARLTDQGSIEERLPFMAIRLPDTVRKRSPETQWALEMNANVLTTPHDIHSTLLDVIDLPQFMNDYKVKGASYPRGLSLLKPIPVNRSCGEAGITPFWCTCVEWEDVKKTDAMHANIAQSLIDHINSMTTALRSSCAYRSLTSIEWIKKGKKTKHINRTVSGVRYQNDKFFVKLTAGPGVGVYEGLVKYLANKNQFVVCNKEISRVNEYGREPDCISAKYPHLRIYCYCNENL